MLNLPYPISQNRYWRVRVIKGVAMTYVSTEAKAYKQEAAWKAKAAGIRVALGDVAMAVILHPKKNKDGSASKTRLDLDNCIKVLFDALNGVAYADDKQVVRIGAEIGNPVEGGGVSVKVIAI